MATAYFIDEDWHYQEMLLGFKLLHSPHTENSLSDVLY